MICFQEMCYPALVGNKTPIGEFTLSHRSTVIPGYGGDILQFHEDKTTIYAVHRVLTTNPKQQREKRLRSKNPKDRKITNGCVNVDPEVYKLLTECCVDSKISIIKK